MGTISPVTTENLDSTPKADEAIEEVKDEVETPEVEESDDSDTPEEETKE